MLTKLKNNIENWLKRLIRQEVSHIDTSLQRERAAFDAQVQCFDVHVQFFKVQFDEALQSLIAQSNPHAENRELRRTIKELDAGLAEMKDTLKRLHPGTF